MGSLKHLLPLIACFIQLNIPFTCILFYLKAFAYYNWSNIWNVTSNPEEFIVMTTLNHRKLHLPYYSIIRCNLKKMNPNIWGSISNRIFIDTSTFCFTSESNYQNQQSLFICKVCAWLQPSYYLQNKHNANFLW